MASSCNKLMNEESGHNELGLRDSLKNLNISTDTRTTKRENYFDWDELFMAMAVLIAKRSKDPCSQVGACIVNDENKIVGLGYNGMPIGCSDDEFPWGKKENSEENKHLYVCHAEMNAILNKNSHDVKGCSLYVSLFPCNECAKIIIQARIKNVIYISDKNALKISGRASKRMFQAAGVKYWQFVPKRPRVTIDFTMPAALNGFVADSLDTPDSTDDSIK